MNALESYADRMNYHSHVDCKKFTAVWKTSFSKNHFQSL